MKKILNLIKAAALLGALAIAAVSAIPNSAEAYEGETCLSSGHSCHAIIDGKKHHLYLWQ